MSKLSEIKKLSENQMTGDERFSYNGEKTDMTMLEFWRWHFSEIFDLQSKISESCILALQGQYGLQGSGQKPHGSRQDHHGDD